MTPDQQGDQQHFLAEKNPAHFNIYYCGTHLWNDLVHTTKQFNDISPKPLISKKLK